MTTYYPMLHQVQQSSRASKCLVLVLLLITGAILSVSGSPIPSGGNPNWDVIFFDSSDEDSQQQEEDVHFPHQCLDILLDWFEQDKREILDLCKDESGNKNQKYNNKHYNSNKYLWESLAYEFSRIRNLVETENCGKFKIPASSQRASLTKEKEPSTFDRIKAVKKSMNGHQQAMSDVIKEIKWVIVDPDGRKQFEGYCDGIFETINAMEGNLRDYAQVKSINVEAIWGTSDAAVNTQPGTSSGQALGRTNADAASDPHLKPRIGTNLEDRPDYWLSH